MEDFTTEVTERIAEAKQGSDEHHVLITTVNDKLDTMMDMLRNVRSQDVPTFEISTPVRAGVLETHTPDLMRRSAHFAAAVDEAANPDERPISNIPEPRLVREPRIAASPPMTSFVDNGGDGYQQRESNSRPQRPPADYDQQEVGKGYGHGKGQSMPLQFMWGQGAPIMTNQNFRICQKPNLRLFAFDGQMVNYKLWRKRIKDHLCNRSTRRYESLLDNIEK